MDNRKTLAQLYAEDELYIFYGDDLYNHLLAEDELNTKYIDRIEKVKQDIINREMGNIKGLTDKEVGIRITDRLKESI
jgi:hypothetical protein